MKLIQADKDRFVFHLGKREKRSLFEVLKLYPLIPASCQRVSKSAKDLAQKASQQLLEEALAAQRQESKKQVRAMLNEPARVPEQGLHQLLVLRALLGQRLVQQPLVRLLVRDPA